MRKNRIEQVAAEAKVDPDSLRQARFANLFAGRPDAYGGDEGRAIWEPITPQVIEHHLTGIEGCGVYPIRHTPGEGLIVRWGCCDIDTGDWNEAYQLATALKGMGLNPWIERSRSKGWHIWIFTENWVPAKDMRRCLKVAYAAIDLPAKEANPKQETLRPNQLGNYVRLPYKSGLILDPERQCMMAKWGKMQDGRPLTFREFIDGEDVFWDEWHGKTLFKHPGFYSDAETISKWASKWFERPKAMQEFPQEIPEDMQPLLARVPFHSRIVVQEGPKNADRSATLQALAFELARQGWKAGDIYAVIRYADNIWGKYHQRPDGHEYLMDIVNRALS